MHWQSKNFKNIVKLKAQVAEQLVKIIYLWKKPWRYICVRTHIGMQKYWIGIEQKAEPKAMGSGEA